LGFGPRASASGLSWEWDGSDWRGGVSHLPARFSHALGYDATRRRTIALGGILPYVPSPLVSDVWEYDGIRWTQVAQLPGSPAAGTWAMAHDPARRTNLVVGSTAGETQTWEWDGTSWRRASTAPPFVASGQGLVHDPRRGRTVLFGGFERSPGNATWEWDGSNWSRRTAERPVARVGASMTFDVARRRFVLFGGKADLESYALTDLWELTEGVWERRTFRAAPLARLGAAMAHDLSRGRTVLFGGTVGCPLPGFPCAFEDTWEWDGNIWQERAPSVRPPARFAHAMTWDGARARVLLFGGIDVRGAALADTWEWDGSAWLRRFPVHAPPPLHEHGMAFDEARGVVVLLDSGTPPSTWEWDGSDWTERRPPVSPPVGGGPLAYDRERRRTLFFAPDARSWEWDGQTWSLLATPEPPPPRRFHALAHDPVGRRTILFGGLGDGGTLGDTWELRDPCPVAGPGHPGGGLPVECRGAARPGGTLCVSFSLPPPRGAGFSLLLLAPGSALDPPREVLPPAVCRAALLHVLPVSVRSAGGEPAVFCLGLPDHPALAGQSFTLQGAAFETAGCFTATDAITARIAP